MSSVAPSQPEMNAEDTAAALKMLHDRLEDMRKFTARRFDEISMEINAASQQFEMAENGLSAKFGNVMTALSAISFQGSGDTPHNMGIELSAVIKSTEEAANSIIESVFNIDALLDKIVQCETPMERSQMAEGIKLHTQSVMMACSFQDLTGQRINQTIEKIKSAETELQETLKGLGINVDTSDETMLQNVLPNAIASNQADIDALFS